MVVGEAKNILWGLGSFFGGRAVYQTESMSGIPGPWPMGWRLLFTYANTKLKLSNCASKQTSSTEQLGICSKFDDISPTYRCKPMIPRESLEAWQWYGKLMGRGLLYWRSLEKFEHVSRTWSWKARMSELGVNLVRYCKNHSWVIWVITRLGGSSQDS